MSDSALKYRDAENIQNDKSDWFSSNKKVSGMKVST
jgi:hypothetical protein